MEKCQCLTGDFQLQESLNGFRIIPETASTLTPKDIKKGKEPVQPMFKREICFDEESFDLRPCFANDEGCEALVPCREADDEQCFKLLSA